MISPPTYNSVAGGSGIRERLGGGDGAKVAAEPESRLHMQDMKQCGFWEARSRRAAGSLTEVLEE